MFKLTLKLFSDSVQFLLAGSGAKAPVNPRGPFGGGTAVASGMDDPDDGSSSRMLLALALRRQAAKDQLQAKLREKKMTEAAALAEEVRILGQAIAALDAKIGE